MVGGAMSEVQRNMATLAPEDRAAIAAYLKAVAARPPGPVTLPAGDRVPAPLQSRPAAAPRAKGSGRPAGEVAKRPPRGGRVGRCPGRGPGRDAPTGAPGRQRHAG